VVYSGVPAHWCMVAVVMVVKPTMRGYVVIYPDASNLSTLRLVLKSGFTSRAFSSPFDFMLCD